MILIISFLSTLQLDLQTQLLQQVQGLMGYETANVLKAIMEKAESRQDLSTVGGWMGSLTLFFSASVIFAHLQSTLNLIFCSEMKKDTESSWIYKVRFFVVKRLISFGIVLSFIFISIVSLLFYRSFLCF